VSESPETTPLSAEEEAEVRRRDANASAHPATWAIEDRRRLLATLDAARATVPAADDRLREAAQRVVAAKPVRWNDRPADSFIEAVGVLRTTLDATDALRAALGEENDRG
jgi:hypothetical protein